MAHIVLIGAFAVVVGMITWGTGRLIDAMRSRERLVDRLNIDHS